MSDNEAKNQTNIFSVKKVLAFLALILFLIANWLWLDYKRFTKTNIVFNNAKIISIENGETVSSLTEKLFRERLIDKKWPFKILLRIHPELAKLQVGEYPVDREMKPFKLLKRLTSGQVIQYPFSIIEGQTIHQVMNRLLANKQLNKSSETLVTSKETIRELAKYLGIENQNPEGWFFPDTYFFVKGDSWRDLLKRSHIAMQQALLQEWAERAPNLPYKTPYEALIMASIIEKETGVAHEREQIAGVFVRRLEKNMRLQTDPTVIYGVGDDYDGDITRKHLKTPTPYNTYTIKGLPPTPISVVSRASIYAALHPAKGETLYFVADGSGGHYFSKTNDEHQKAVQRMLARQKN